MFFIDGVLYSIRRKLAPPVCFIPSTIDPTLEPLYRVLACSTVFDVAVGPRFASFVFDDESLARTRSYGPSADLLHDGVSLSLWPPAFSAVNLLTLSWP
jgi:hypothetical protein